MIKIVPAKVIRNLVIRGIKLLGGAWVIALASGCAVTGEMVTKFESAGSAAPVAEAPIVKTILASTTPQIVPETMMCPGVGVAGCEANWAAVALGLEAVKVSELLGEAELQHAEEIYIDRVVMQWSYPEFGLISFTDGRVSHLELPQSYLF